MAMQPKPAPFEINPAATPEERVADALEFMALRMANMEQCLTVIRDDLRGFCHMQGQMASQPPVKPS